MLFYICFALGLVFAAGTFYYRHLWKSIDSQSCYYQDVYSIALAMAQMDHYSLMQYRLAAIAIGLISFAIGSFQSCL